MWTAIYLVPHPLVANVSGGSPSPQRAERECDCTRWLSGWYWILVFIIPKLGYRKAWIQICIDPHAIGTLDPDPDLHGDFGLDPDPDPDPQKKECRSQTLDMWFMFEETA
jgi:hypothetical protein